ncbi:MAG: HEAT repeat domain-containing protein, partial [Deltaproteobacteria bacterium]|nr:HEAT repeat domain-containing protein [Deltaproteobacteria bacterium]
AAPRVGGDADGHSATYASAEDVAAMRELFTETERALIARRQYGARHPETRRRSDRAFKVAASGLMHSEYGLVWNVTPYSFVSGDQTVWEPEAPLDRIPYQLFADGVRLLGLSPGLSEDEFQAFFRVVTLDRATEVAPEDDFATLLWDADFQSVVYQVVDTFADGDHAQRVRFEAARQGVVELAHVDTSEQLSDCWAERQAAARTEAVQPRFRAITSRLGAGGPIDAEAAARAADMKVATGQTATVVDAAALRVDDALRTMLGARLTMETGGLSERFTVVVARAYEDGAARDAGAAVATPLRFAIDGLARENPDLAIDMVGALCREVGARVRSEEGDALRARFAAAIVSPKMLEAVLEGVSRAEGGAVAVFAKGLRTILGYCDATYFAAVLPHLGRMPDEELREVLVEYIVRTGAGREAELGAMFKEADIELGLMLVRILAQMGTKGALEAISHASSSPHPVVRIEALGHVEGVSSERLRLELRALLEDREPAVRLAALRTMEQYTIRVAGPFLVLRVRTPEFDSLSQDERRQALRTLAALAPTRAEAVAFELLGDRRLITADEHEVTRGLAAELLGQLGVTEESRKLLAELATARLRNSDRVRHAAGKALEAFDARVAALADAASRPQPAGRSHVAARPAPGAQAGTGKGTRG